MHPPRRREVVLLRRHDRPEPDLRDPRPHDLGPPRQLEGRHDRARVQLDVAGVAGVARRDRRSASAGEPSPAAAAGAIRLWPSRRPCGIPRADTDRTAAWPRSRRTTIPTRSPRSRRSSRTRATAGCSSSSTTRTARTRATSSIPAQMCTPTAINFMATHGRGLICLALPGERLDALGLPLMAQANSSRPRDRLHRLDRGARGRDHRHLGARPRPHRRRRDRPALGRRRTSPRPATSSRLRARDGGVLVRAGHTEAAVDIARLAGLNPVGGDLRDHERGRHAWRGCPTSSPSPSATR